MLYLPLIRVYVSKVRDRRLIYAIVLAVLSSGGIRAQEVLSPSVVSSRARLKNLPALGVPCRADGSYDPVVMFSQGSWSGSASCDAPPQWTMFMLDEDGPVPQEILAPFLAVGRKWAGEKPRAKVFVVYGSLGKGHFVAICKKARNALGWRSLAFAIPPGGMTGGAASARRIPSGDPYYYSVSVNWIEHRIGYNLFPLLPLFNQEVIEEMGPEELLCSFQEFDPAVSEGPDPEVFHVDEIDSSDL